MKLKDIEDGVRRLLNDFTLDFWTEIDMKKFANEAQLYLINVLPKDKLIDLARDYIIDDVTGYVINLPTDFVEEYFVKYDNRILAKLTLDTLRKYEYRIKNEPFTGWYYVENTKIQLNPNLELHKKLEMKYVKYPTAFIDAESVSDYSDKFLNIMINLVAMEALKKDRIDNPIYVEVKEKFYATLSLLIGKDMKPAQQAA
jgi:hypothetical protein